MSLSPVSGRAWHKWWTNSYKHQQTWRTLDYVCFQLYLENQNYGQIECSEGIRLEYLDHIFRCFHFAKVGITMKINSMKTCNVFSWHELHVFQSFNNKGYYTWAILCHLFKLHYNTINKEVFYGNRSPLFIFSDLHPAQEGQSSSPIKLKKTS